MSLEKPYPTTLKFFFGRALATMVNRIDTNIEIVEETLRRKVARGYTQEKKCYEFIKCTDDRRKTHYFVDDVTNPEERKYVSEYTACTEIINYFNSLPGNKR
jgi:hypothetical protein